jgi:hypothetical protein
MQMDLNYQSLISIDPPFDPVPLLLMLLHPWADHVSWCEPTNKYPNIPIQKKKASRTTLKNLHLIILIMLLGLDNF